MADGIASQIEYVNSLPIDQKEKDKRIQNLLVHGIGMGLVIGAFMLPPKRLEQIMRFSGNLARGMGQTLFSGLPSLAPVAIPLTNKLKWLVDYMAVLRTKYASLSQQHYAKAGQHAENLRNHFNNRIDPNHPNYDAQYAMAVEGGPIVRMNGTWGVIDDVFMHLMASSDAVYQALVRFDNRLGSLSQKLAGGGSDINWPKELGLLLKEGVAAGIFKSAEQGAGVLKWLFQHVERVASMSVDDIARQMDETRTASTSKGKEKTGGKAKEDGVEAGGKGNDYVSASKKPFGLQLSREQIKAKYGNDGLKLVDEVDELTRTIRGKYSSNNAIRKNEGPVITGVRHPLLKKTFIGKNANELPDPLHSLLKKEFDNLNKGKNSGEIVGDKNDIAKAGKAGHHSEVYAMNEALFALENKLGAGMVTKEMFGEFILYNRSLIKEGGVPPRCFNCRYITDGVRVIGNN